MPTTSDFLCHNDTVQFPIVQVVNCCVCSFFRLMTPDFCACKDPHFEFENFSTYLPLANSKNKYTEYVSTSGNNLSETMINRSPAAWTAFTQPINILIVPVQGDKSKSLLIKSSMICTLCDSFVLCRTVWVYFSYTGVHTKNHCLSARSIICCKDLFFFDRFLLL